MKEHVFINTIKGLTQSKYLGDDCAFLEDLGIVVTQDNFIENVHFKRDWATPYQIGYKATIVNISDILASGAKPAYLSIGLSLPNNIDNEFIENFYKGILAGSNGAKVIGGDITGGDIIAISITAIGKTESRKISSRSNAKPSYVVITRGKFGESTIGLKQLQEGIKESRYIKQHLEPILDFDFSESISTKIKDNYAMMDTSDGLADALFQIAKSSNVKIVVKEIDGIFGAEDYKLVAVLPEIFAKTLNNVDFIGKVYEYDGTYLQIGENEYSNYDSLNLYNHFN